MRAKSLMTCVALATVGACSRSQSPSSFPPTANSYFDNAGRDDVLAGGVKMIPVTTPKGTFQVWTKRIGNNPRIKVLLLHGGPGVTHEYLEAFDSYMPGAGIEYYYYDQLGSYYSDQPNEPSLWELPRFVDEVEQGFATETAVVWVDHAFHVLGPNALSTSTRHFAPRTAYPRFPYMRSARMNWPRRLPTTGRVLRDSPK